MIRRVIHRYIKKTSSGFFPARFALTRSSDSRVSSKLLTQQKATSLNFPETDSPIVSIIIPVYNQIDLTIDCLASIQEHPPEADVEIIVVDDCSSDSEARLLEKIPGIRFLRNERNLGFIASCNKGALRARGEYLHFLNSDTHVTPGWLDELVATFNRMPGAGLVGSKLLFPDGTLQEAGGIIWEDGSGWNYGRGDDPEKPEYNFMREVDYCSGASIMTPRDIFEELKGFDSIFSPAYCEDSDYAFRVRAIGRKVVYQPASVVFHHEGASSGTDLLSGVKKHQVSNSATLYDRWKATLRNHGSPGINLDRARNRKLPRRALVLDLVTPTPEKDAGSVTALNYMILLREMGYQVTFIPLSNFSNTVPHTQNLQTIGVEALYYPFVASLEAHLKSAENRYDLVLAFRHESITPHLEVIRKHCPKAKILFHAIDLHFLRLQRHAEAEASAGKWRKLALEAKRLEIKAVSSADLTIVHSDVERKILGEVSPNSCVTVAPLLLESPGTSKSFRDRSGIVFLGGYGHPPNVDAVHFLAQEIMPILRETLPGVSVHIAGSNPPDSFSNLAAPDFVIDGFVEELDSYLERFRLFCSPLRIGAGVKGKIGTAMGRGLPVVATPVSVEGMGLVTGVNCLVADSAVDIAKALSVVYHDENSWTNLSGESIEFAKRHWGANAGWAHLERILSIAGLEVNPKPVNIMLYPKIYGPHSTCYRA